MVGTKITKEQRKQDSGATYDEAFDLVMVGQYAEASRVLSRNTVFSGRAIEVIAAIRALPVETVEEVES
jgi:hypothetical protein